MDAAHLQSVIWSPMRVPVPGASLGPPSQNNLLTLGGATLTLGAANLTLG